MRIIKRVCVWCRDEAHLRSHIWVGSRSRVHWTLSRRIRNRRCKKNAFWESTASERWRDFWCFWSSGGKIETLGVGLWGFVTNNLRWGFNNRLAKASKSVERWMKWQNSGWLTGSRPQEVNTLCSRFQACLSKRGWGWSMTARSLNPSFMFKNKIFPFSRAQLHSINYDLLSKWVGVHWLPALHNY